MRIIVAGLPGVKTQRTLTNVEEAVSKFDDDIDVEWRQHPCAAPVQGSVYTPSVLINSRVRVAGRIPSLHEISTWIAEELENEFAA
jgi:thioredoxin family protein